ncbi:chitinase [Sediminibacterium sp.]|uniref:chitinase n=1 Tax=Sediminibacterium sp. TaxID=1917865 RepID=UPI0027342DAA|nr:chitinase [Sediminibacterium sp.]MDP3392614.1 chitinase [Sediminibacterium sp.]MDP3566143.1 chitinase [Sediminibacterium sp.]
MKSTQYLLFLVFGLLLIQACVTNKKEDNDSFPLLSETEWNQLFPHMNGGDSLGKLFYSYTAFVKATKRFPQFLNEGSTQLKKRELAAFLATISHETGGGNENDMVHFYDFGLYYKEELACLNGCASYSDTTSLNYPPAKGKSYHGRGPIQLSWNYNYGLFSETVLGNKDSLLNNPDLLTIDPELSFTSAIWFWVTAQEPKPSCHDVMSGKWVPNETDSLAGRKPGFGAVMNIVNGGLECGGIESVKNKFRLEYYLAFCKKMKVDPGPNISCNSQQPYGQ